MSRMLNTALSRLGPGPLLTYYDPDSRIELSGVTFNNWVAKTANLLDDCAAGQQVCLGLTETDPGHWVTLVWAAATWFSGRELVVGVPDGAEFAVVNGDDARGGETTVACSMHPLGRGLSAPRDGAIDYADVLAQPDAALAPQPEPDDPAWESRTHADLAVPGRHDRLAFVDPGFDWPTVAALLLAPILGGGSSVVICGLNEHEIDRALTAEKATRWRA